MARRSKQADELETESEATWDGAEFAEFIEPFVPSVEELGALAGEVQSFLDKRIELARKLSQEIDATEKKLAELKRTAAALFPEGSAESDSERERPERKPKKPAAKSVRLSQPEPSESTPPASTETEPPAASPPAASEPISGEPMAQVA